MRLAMDCLAAGMNPHQAARASGVSSSTLYVLHKSLGGVYRPPGTSFSDRYLDRDDRYEIARLLDAGCGYLEIGRQLGRDRVTIWREVKRNSDPKTGRYQPEKADRLAWERQRRPKPS